MKKLNIILIVLVCISCLVLVTAHLKKSHQGSLIKIGINEWAGYDPFILADKKGFFKKNNVSVEVKRFASATEEMRALKNGQIQGGGFTLDEAFTIINSGFKGKVVLVVDYSEGGDMLIGQKEITHVSQLVGKTVGYEGSVVGQFLLDRALRANYVKKRDIHLIDVPADNWLVTFKERKVDAIVCFNPVATKLLNDYEGRLLFSSADMPFEIIDVLLLSESFYNDNRVAVANIIKAWFDALRYIKHNLDEAALIIATEKNISAEEYIVSLDGLVAPDLEANKVIMDAKSNKNIYKHAQVIVDFMLSEGSLSQRINTSDVFQAEIIFALESNSEG